MHDNQIPLILDYWFAETGAHSPTAIDRKRWFGGGDVLDAEITQKFAHLFDQSLVSWLQTPLGAVAYVVLHDQFPLNVFRRQARAFAFEELAEQATLHALENNFDQNLAYGERVFLYMPLMHAEKLSLQELGVEKFDELAQQVDGSLQEAAQGNLKFAREHRDTVARFGRFPFRNKVLNRKSTAEEIDFLDSGAPRYGQ